MKVLSRFFLLFFYFQTSRVDLVFAFIIRVVVVGIES